MKGRKDPRLSRTLHGSLDTLWSGLDAVNSTGAGVFVTVNAIRYREKRKIENLARVRAIWQDDDAGFTGEYPLAPSLVTLTSVGKFHRIWVTEGLTPEQHQAVMRRMVQDYGCDKGASDLVRVLRLPGFYHMKDRDQPAARGAYGGHRRDIQRRRDHGGIPAPMAGARVCCLLYCSTGALRQCFE